MHSYRFHITFLILWLSFNLLAQVEQLPMACAGSKARYGVAGLPNSVFEWTVVGGRVVANYNDSIDVLWGFNEGHYMLSVREHTAYNCSTSPSFADVLVTVPSLDMAAEVDICKGDSIVLELDNNQYKNLKWQNDVYQSTFTVSESGIVYVEAIDKNGCRVKDSVWVNVHQSPDVALGDDTTLCGNSYLVLDAGYAGSHFNWSTGDISQSIVVQPGPQTISVEVENEYGCLGADTISIFACAEIDEMMRRIPTAITPNGDGQNDVFKIPYIENFPDAEVEIFDRWGRSIFKSDKGYTEEWDGTLRGKPLPVDSYYYVINFGNNIEPISGNIAIIR